MSLNGKVAVITGASMGIGEAIAKLFADQGASVVLSSRDLGRAEAARARVGHSERTLAVACDVSRADEVQKLAQAALARFGRIDIWVNNAGHGLIDSVATMDLGECRRLFDTNLFGAIHGMQVAAPILKRQGSGTIINISSVAGHIAVPGMAAYSATKFAMNAIGKGARVELKGTGVHVMTVCPGYITTDFGANAVKGSEAKRLGAARRGIPAERVARAVLRGYLGQKREVVVPWRDRIAIKLYQLFPRLIERAMARMLRPAEQVLAEREALRQRDRQAAS
ncbi:MAG TPA: SDR family NAD(P)-dependent oxidoreductase [Terriglobales bacterium]|nr:SDR family NAD(P)-dependent oxidoreductase [Terriglobales bacterium]